MLFTYREAPRLLYLGKPCTAQLLQTALESVGGYIYTPSGLYDTLGMVVTYWPDLVILDCAAEPELADLIATHLASIDVEPLLIHDERELMDILREHIPTLEESQL